MLYSPKRVLRLIILYLDNTRLFYCEPERERKRVRETERETGRERESETE